MENLSISCSDEPLPTPIREVGELPIEVFMSLYELSSAPFKDATFSLRLIPAQWRQQFISNMADDRVSAFCRCPKGFINETDSNMEPIYYTWPITMQKHLDVKVLVKDRGQEKCRVMFAQNIDAIKERVYRQTILSQPWFSRLPTIDCASVDFTIVAGCRETCSRRFEVVVESDLGEKNSKDYNVMFVRKAPAPQHPGLSQLPSLGYQNVASFQGGAGGQRW